MRVIPVICPLAAFLLALASAPAVAQPPGTFTASDDGPTVSWTAAVGRQMFSFRDVARSRRPVEASPVRWRGTGPTVVGRFDRLHRGRLHRLAFTASSAGGFSHASKVLSAPAPADDRMNRVEARYEYRRYLFAGRLFDGFAVGLGVQGLGSRLSIAQHVAPGHRFRETATGAGAAGTVAARITRWRRIHVEAEWTNGALLGRSDAVHSADAFPAPGRLNGGWLTDASAVAELKIAARLWLVGSYVRTGDGILSNHHSYAMQRHHVSVGMTYGR